MKKQNFHNNRRRIMVFTRRYISITYILKIYLNKQKKKKHCEAAIIFSLII